MRIKQTYMDLCGRENVRYVYKYIKRKKVNRLDKENLDKYIKGKLKEKDYGIKDIDKKFKKI